MRQQVSRLDCVCHPINDIIWDDIKFPMWQIAKTAVRFDFWNYVTDSMLIATYELNKMVHSHFDKMKFNE